MSGRIYMRTSKVMLKMRYSGIVWTLVAAAILVGLVAYFMRPAPIRVARHALRQAAGAEARDCDWSGADKDRLRQKACVEDAVARSRPSSPLWLG